MLASVTHSSDPVLNDIRGRIPKQTSEEQTNHCVELQPELYWVLQRGPVELKRVYVSINRNHFHHGTNPKISKKYLRNLFHTKSIKCAHLTL